MIEVRIRFQINQVNEFNRSCAHWSVSVKDKENTDWASTDIRCSHIP